MDLIYIYIYVYIYICSNNFNAFLMNLIHIEQLNNGLAMQSNNRSECVNKCTAICFLPSLIECLPKT